jgi:TfoX/Sxy family transcriptional regulator of competence genes
MPWTKIPAEHHPLFLAALPPDPRIETIKMFGGIGAKANGHFFAGLFGPTAMVMLDDKERAKALALPGATPFDPMGRGDYNSDKVQLPLDVFTDPKKLKAWIKKAFTFAVERPTKEAKKAPKTAAKTGARAPARSSRPTKRAR